MVILMLFALLASPLAAEAQQAGKVYRIGVLAFADSPGWEAFRQRSRDGRWGCNFKS